MDLNNSVFHAAQMLGAPVDETDLEKRLGLYQVFCKLYEQHPDLLDEILELENVDGTANRATPRYIVGMVQQGQPYLLTNLLGGRSQNLYQRDCCWLIGRSPDASLPFPDRRLSRHHAVIQYIAGEGFDLVDLKSTNGSFVNGEAIRHRHRLQEGDRIRVGSLVVQFYASPEAQRLPALSDEVRSHSSLSLSAVWNGEPPPEGRAEDTQTFMHGDAESEVASAKLANRQARALDWMHSDE